MALNLGELNAIISADDRGFNRTIDRVHDKMEKVSKRMGGLTGLLSVLGKATAFSALAAGAAGAASSMGPLVGLVGVLGVAVGTLGAAIPAFLAGAAVAVATLTIGFSNMGDAISGDEEALEKLAPAAKEVVGVLSDLKDEWKAVTRSVQQKLFEGLADDLSVVAKTWLPLLDKGLGKVAGGFNSVAQSAAKALTQSKVIEGFNAVVDNTAQGLKNFAVGVGPWLAGIGVLLSAFSPLLAEAGTWAAALGERFAEWITYKESTGQLLDFINQMKDTFSTLGDIVSNVGSILFNVFAATQESGGGLLGTIEDLTGQFADFLNSAEGWEALNTFFGALKDVGNAVLPIILSLAEAFGTDLAPKIGDIAEGVGPSLSALITEIGDAIGEIDVKELAEGFTDVLDAITPLIGPLGDFVGGATELDGLVPALVVGLGAWTVAQWALNTALWANPIALLIGLIIALVAVIALAILNWDKIVIAFKLGWLYIEDAFAKGKAAVDVLLRAVADFFIQRWTSIVATTQRAIDGVLAFIGRIAEVPGRIAAWLTDMKDRAVAKFQEFVSAAGNKIDAVLGVIQRLGGIPGKIAGFVQSAKDQAVSKFNSLVDWVKGLPDRISNALGDLGSLLKNAGRDIINGLLDGITEKFGAVQDKLSELTGMLPNWKGPEAVDKKLLFKPGTWVIGGLIEGLDSMIPQVERTLQGLTTDIGLQVDAAAAPARPTAPVTRFSDDDRQLLAGVGAMRGRTEQTFVVNGSDQDPATLAHELDWLSRRRP
jgi:phage-related protein